MECNNDIICLIVRSICELIDCKELIKTLKSNKEELYQSLYEKIIKNEDKYIDAIYEFLVEQQMVPENLSQFNIRYNDVDSTPLSALLVLHYTSLKIYKRHFRNIIATNFDRFSSCSAICLFINKHKWCYFAKDRMKKCIAENKHCIFYDSFIEKAEELRSNIVGEIKNGLGFRTLLKFGEEIYDEKLRYERELNEFNIKNIRKIKNYKNHLFVLRKFNSFPPILNNGLNVGGGYFFWTGSKGIVIDPGIDFIKNFIESGFPISLIDQIIVTHAHPDHIADLSNILTLHYEQNEYNQSCNRMITPAIKQSVNFFNNRIKRKKLDLFLNLSSYEYLSGLINIDNTKVDYNIHILEGGNTIALSDDLDLLVLPTIHKDCLASNLGIGIVLRSFNKKFQLIYTSDTSLSIQLIEKYKTILGGNEFKTILLANIGGIHKKELDSLFYIDIIEDNLEYLVNEFKYPNHLGILGLVSLINAIKPNAVLIGEIGIEMQNIKIELANKISEEVNIPCNIADLGLSLDLENLNAYALMVDDSLKPIKMSEISCCPNENGDCIYISNALNKDFINTSRYKNNPKIWLLNNPIFRN